MAEAIIDVCPAHGGPVRKEYDFGALSPQPHVTVFRGCKCARFDAEMPGGHEARLCASYAEAEGFARMALAIWKSL